MNYLLDTNTIIYYLKAALPIHAMKAMNKIVDIKPNLSVITKIELLCFKGTKQSEEKITRTFVDASTVFGLDNDIVNKTIVLRKLHPIKLPDAIIAATAIVFNLVLITRNMSDFESIVSLKCIDPNMM